MNHMYKKTSAVTEVGLIPIKLYHRSKEVQCYRISLLITTVILVISLIVNLILLPSHFMDKATKEQTKQESGFLDSSTLNELPIVLINEGNPSLAYQDPNKEPLYETMPICSITSTFKSWMDHDTITNHSTRQWALKQIATTDESGFRKIDDFYMVAMAKQYGPVGTKYLITFSSGSRIYVIIGDLKAGTTCVHPDKSMIEFIVSTDTLLKSVKSSGNVNKVFEGTIVEIRKVE